MVRKLQRRFILIAVLSVLAVLVVMMCIINGSNYRSVVAEADWTTSLIAENGGSFPRSALRRDESTEKDAGSAQRQPAGVKPPESGQRELSAEAPFETRFFVVNLDKDGDPSAVNTGNIASVTTSQATAYAAQVYKSGRSSGFIGDYRFGVRARTDGEMLVFLDCSRELRYFHSFLYTSLVVSALALLGVFILVLLFSRRAIQPIADAYEKQKHFITDAGHELKTPLAVISANTEVLEMTQGESEWTQSIRNQVGRLAELTNDLVSLARMDERDSRMLMTDFSLSDAVSESLAPFVAVAGQRGKPIQTDIQEGLTLCGNEEAIRRLVGILADNAIKYGAEGGEIRITLRSAGRGMVFQTRNRVETPIKKGAHEELFERFYRGDASRSSKVAGYGIGLSMARAIVAAHRGKISAASEDGASLAITVAL